jgi:RimJ/RimL family protein N-acetyltransferase
MAGKLGQTPPCSLNTHPGRQASAVHTEDRRFRPVPGTTIGAHAIEHGEATPIARLPGSEPWCRRVVLADGSAALIRRVCPDDRDALLRFLQGLSTSSVYLRFCSAGANLEAGVDRFIEIADDRFGLLACDPDGEIIAHAEYLLLPSDQAEVAVVVADRLHRQGLARRMIESLAAHAQSRGIETFVASVLPENGPMLSVFARAFAATVSESSSMICNVSFVLAQSSTELRAA